MKPRVAWIISAVLLVAVVTSIFIFVPLGEQTATATGSYTCPVSHRCTVTPVLFCENEQQDVRVKFRTNANVGASSLRDDYANKWIVIDLFNNGLLERFSYDSHRAGQGSATCRERGDFILLTPDGYRVTYDIQSNKLYVYAVCRNSRSFDYVIFEPTVFEGDATLTPKEPYSSNRQEIVEGNLYSCQSNIFVNAVNQETIVWSSNNPTPPSGRQGNTYTLEEFDRVTASGGGVTQFQFIQEFIEEPITTCTTSDNRVINIGEAVCVDAETLERCEVPDSTQTPRITQEFAASGQVCRDGDITKAYDVEIFVERVVIAEGENLEIDFELTNTPFKENIDVVATVLKGSQPLTVKRQKTGNTRSTAGKTHFSIPSPITGFYTLQISFNHPDGNFRQEFDIHVTGPLSLEPRVASPIQFDNKNIEVILESFKGGTFKELADYDIEAKYNGFSVIPVVIESGGIGRLKFLFDLDGDGTLRVRFRGKDETGLLTAWTDFIEVSVKKSTILITTDFVTNKCIGAHTQRFETRDSTGQLAETQNTIIVEKPTFGETDTLTATGSKGKYQFTYNFDQGGLYILRVTSSSPSLGVVELNGGLGESVEMQSGSSCVGSDPSGNEGPNFLLYGIIGFLIMVIGFFGYLVLRKK